MLPRHFIVENGNLSETRDCKVVKEKKAVFDREPIGKYFAFYL
jgi:hypothetical protein